jgi:hypothetical protein
VVATILIALFAGEACGQLYEVRPPRSGPGARGRMMPPATGAASGSRTASSDTEITLEIFTGKEGVSYEAQRWQPAFDRAGVMARIRPGIPSDKVSIKERKYGKLRQVFLTGKLERDGTLVFPGRSFSRSDSSALEEWLATLKSYGAQGDPAGQSHWGLSKEQSDEVFQALSAPVDEEVADRPFDEAIASLHLPIEHPFRLAVSAERHLRTVAELRSRRPRISVRGFTKGTALAMVLSQYGLGFSPHRTPDGTLVLFCVAADEEQQLWPIGWDRPDGMPPSKFAPRLYDQTRVELKDQKLVDVLQAIEKKTGVPIRIDRAGTEARHIDLDSILVSIPGRRVAWASLLMSLTSPSFLMAKIRTDEASKPFVWVAPLPKRTANPKR